MVLLCLIHTNSEIEEITIKPVQKTIDELNPEKNPAYKENDLDIFMRGKAKNKANYLHWKKIMTIQQDNKFIVLWGYTSGTTQHTNIYGDDKKQFVLFEDIVVASFEENVLLKNIVDTNKNICKLFLQNAVAKVDFCPKEVPKKETKNNQKSDSKQKQEKVEKPGLEEKSDEVDEDEEDDDEDEDDDENIILDEDEEIDFCDHEEDDDDANEEYDEDKDFDEDDYDAIDADDAELEFEEYNYPESLKNTTPIPSNDSLLWYV